MADEIKLTKDGGFYYRAMAVHCAFVAVFVIPVFVLVIIANLNPFWFRQDLFVLVEHKVNQLVRWRDRLKYRVYLGTDPKMWHALKDSK